jgi:HEAT repeat protein
MKTQVTRQGLRGPRMLPDACGWGLAMILLVMGCAQMRLPSMPWQAGPREAPGINTLAGQVAEVKLLASRADSMEPDEVQRVMARFAASFGQDAKSSVPVKMAILTALPEFPASQSVPVVALAIKDADASVRTEACNAAAKIGTGDAMKLLVATLGDEQSNDVRLAAARGLGGFRDPAVVGALGGLLDDRDPAVQYVAMQSLERVTGEDGGQDVRQWKKMLESPEVLTARMAGETLRR